MKLDRFEFDLNLEITKLGLASANPANSANLKGSISKISEISNDMVPCHTSKEPCPQDTHVLFQERSAIREFDGKQSRVEAELGAIEEVMPFLEMVNGSERLVIPGNAPVRYCWWLNGQDPESTLRELGACEETISKYVSQVGGRKLHG